MNLEKFKTKKSKPYGMDFLKCNSRSPQLELHYFLCFRIKNLSKIEMVKLTMAPNVANIIVLTTSSEFKLGMILKKVPPAVPANAGLLDCIGIRIICGSQLTNSRNNTASNDNITTNRD